MASAGLNFANLTPDNGAVRDLKQLIFTAVLDTDNLGALFNVLPKQKHGDKVGIVGEFGLVGKADSGCNKTFDSTAIATSEKTWSIKAWEVALQLCYKDLEGTLAQVAMRTKTDIADLTGTEYLDYVVLPRLELAIRKMLQRFAWFGDEAAAKVSSGGVLKDDANVANFNVTDGVWKRVFALVAANAERHTTIAANAKTTFAEQKSAIREKGVATDVMDNLISDASNELRQAEKQVIFVSQSLKDALNADIKKNNIGSELQWEAMFDGITKTTYNGIEVIALPFWDEIIKGYETVSGGKSWNKPYRAIYTTHDNLLLGVEGENEIADLQVWFSQDKQANHILAMDKVGTLIADNNLIQVAY